MSGAIATSTALTASNQTSQIVSGVNLTVRVSVVGTGTGTAPSGTVTFTNAFGWSSGPQGLKAQNPTTATVTFSLNANNHTGTQSFTATYSGDGSYAASTSSTVASDVPFARQDFGTVNVGDHSASTRVQVPVYADYA